MRMSLIALFLLAAAGTATVPTLTLRNGVKMPMIATGTYQYNESTAEESVTNALKVGFPMLDTALDYWNSDGVGRAIKAAMAGGMKRDQVFVETKVPGCGNPLENTTRNPFTCYKDTQKNLDLVLSQLALEYVDLVILHFPPFPSFALRSCGLLGNLTSCKMARQQWQAMQEFYKAGKAKSIGVSNYCPSCLACLESEEIQPHVNQIMYHLGSGQNAGAASLVAYDKAHGIATQAYSTLGNTPWGKHASADILHGNLTTAIAKAHNVSTVQVALKWVVKHGIAAVTKSASAAHLASDMDLWSWDLTDDEMTQLDNHKSADSPTYPSYACDNMENYPFLVV